MTQRALPRHAVTFHGGERWTAGAIIHFLFDRFLLFPIGAVIAIVWANTAGESYFTFAHRVSFAVNEIAMAFFFGLLVQELVEAMMPGGALHTWRRWSTAIVAAFGGVVGAAFVYVAFLQFKYETLLLPAWPVAIAVDAAATYYVLKLLVPKSGVLPFALLLAITTNIVGVLTIGFRDVTAAALTSGAALLTVAAIIAVALRRARIKSFWPYLFIAGTLSWFALYVGGIHPAFALVPIVPFLPHEPRPRQIFADPPDDDVTHHYEHEWNVLVQCILFFFGLVNAGVLLRHYDTGTWAILAAALVGRPAGIMLAVGLAVAAGLHLPKQVGWRELAVLSLATSSGFTFALFFATAVFPMGAALTQIKLGALLTVAGAVLAVSAARLLGVGIRRRRST